MDFCDFYVNVLNVEIFLKLEKINYYADQNNVLNVKQKLKILKVKRLQLNATNLS